MSIVAQVRFSLPLSLEDMSERVILMPPPHESVAVVFLSGEESFWKGWHTFAGMV